MKKSNNTTKSKQLLIVAMFLFGGMLSGTQAFSQQKPGAAVTGSGTLQLPTNVALNSMYEINLSSFGFTSEAQTKAFFDAHNYQGFAIRPLFSEGKAHIILDIKSHAGWNVAQWNALLLSQTALQPLSN